MTQVLSELRMNTGTTIGMLDSRVLWLGNRTSQGTISMSHLVNRTAVRLTASFSTSGTTVNRTGVAFGPTYTGRRIVILTFQVGVSSSINPIGTVTIGGATANGGDGGNRLPSSAVLGTGIFSANASGTSGTINFSANDSVSWYVRVYSVANVSSSFDSTTWSQTGNNSGSLNIPSNGVAFGAFMNNSTTSSTWTGLGNAGGTNTGSGTRASWAWSNRMSAQTGRTINTSNKDSLHHFGQARSWN